MTEEVGGPQPARPYRRIAAIVVLIGGAAAIATTISRVEKEPVTVRVRLPLGIRALRMDVHRAGASQLVEHLEWSYDENPPETQDADLELAPGKYLVSLNALSPGGRERDPIELEVQKAGPTRLSIDLRAP